MERSHTNLTLSLGVLAENEERENVFPATFLTEGTFNGLFFSAEEIEKAAESMNAQPVNLNHSIDVEDEVGYVSNVGFISNSLKGDIHLTEGTAKFGVARSYILNRRQAGKPPEISVGVFFDLVEHEDGTLEAVNLEFDHLALVTRGACSPESGCGVGLNYEAIFMDPENQDPQDPAEAEPEVADADPAPEPEAQPAKGEPEATEPASEPEPVEPLASDAKPCSCEAELREQVAKLTNERDALQAQLAEMPKRIELAQRCEELGVPVEDGDGVAALENKIAVAEAAVAKLADAEGASDEDPVRQTKPNLQNLNDDEPDADAEARRLLKLSGLDFS